MEAAVLRVGIDDLDEGYFVQQATRVFHGQIPFRDFETLYTPGLAYLHATLFATLGGPSLVSLRVVALIGRGLTAFALYALARPMFRHRWWAAAPAVILLVGLDDSPLRWEPHPGWLSTLFALLAVGCLSQRWLVASGVAVALSYAFKQNTGVFILLAILAWSRSLRPLASFAALTFVWLTPLVLTVGDLGALSPLVGGVNQAALVSAPEPTILIPLACLAGTVWLIRRDSDPRLRWYLLAGGALFLTQYPRMDTLHLAWSAPLLLVLGAAALDRSPAVVAAVALVGTIALLAPTWTSRLAYLSEPRATVAGVEAPTATAADVAGVVAEIQHRSGPGEPIFVYPTSPLLYVLADRPNPTRFDHLNPGSANTSQIDVVVADLERSNVRLVVISDFWQQVWGEPGPNAALEAWLSARYTEVARHGSYRVLSAGL